MTVEVNELIKKNQFEDNEVFSELTKEKEKRDLKNDPEVQKIINKVDEKNITGILSFGKEPATQLSTFADKILNNMKANSIEDSSNLLKQLNKIMDKFDRKDFEKETNGFINRFFKKSKKIIDEIFNKYQTMGKEIDKVYIEIAQYQDEMVKSTDTLEGMYEQNFNYYMELEKYIIAGETKLNDLKNNILPEYEKLAEIGDEIAIMELETLKNGLELFDQRIYDLKMAQMVALQTAPQIRLLQRGNAKLIAKINSAFVTTIPIFKNGLIQAIHAKRQKLVADSLNELDKRTNEMILRNAENISRQSKEISQLAGGPSIKIETIEEAWNIIMDGLTETKVIEEENKLLREEGAKRLLELKENIHAKRDENTDYIHHYDREIGK